MTPIFQRGTFKKGVGISISHSVSYKFDKGPFPLLAAQFKRGAAPPRLVGTRKVKPPSAPSFVPPLQSSFFIPKREIHKGEGKGGQIRGSFLTGPRV